MKKWIAVLLLVLFPIAALAGMTAISDNNLQEVQGQTGITAWAFPFNVNLHSISWGDEDGFGTYTTEGWVTLSSIDFPSILMYGDFDVGTDGTESYLSWYTGPLPFIYGNLTIANVLIGSTAQDSSAGADAGEVRVSGIGVRFWDGTSTLPDGTPDAFIKIGGH